MPPSCRSLFIHGALALAVHAAWAEVPDLSFHLTPGGEVQLEWTTQSGYQYMLEESTALSGWGDAWEKPLVGSGLPLEHEMPAGGEAEFYKVSTDPKQLFNLALPADGTRYNSFAEFDGPRWPSQYGQGHVTLWYKGKFAAYSITIDDNNKPDFPFWLEVSETYGWKITWFVILHPYVWNIYTNVPGTNTGYFGTLADWKTLHDLGHDIQLHGACGSTNTLTTEGYEDHLIRSIKVLEGATGGRVLTYAYPCNTITSDDGLHDYLEPSTRHFISARGGVGGGMTALHLTNYLTTRSLGGNALVNGQPSTAFGRYKEYRSFLYSSYRGWSVTLYHGLSTDAAKANVIETLDWVKAHEDEFWVGTYTDVAKYAQQRESATLEITSATADAIHLNVTDRMDDTIYNHPLTVKLRVDGTWAGATALQGEDPIHAEIVMHEGASYVYVEPIPDRGPVVVQRVP